MPIFLHGARFDELQDVNERGVDAKDPQIGCLVAYTHTLALSLSLSLSLSLCIITQNEPVFTQFEN
jgi:hypothetical protein